MRKASRKNHVRYKIENLKMTERWWCRIVRALLLFSSCKHSTWVHTKPTFAYHIRLHQAAAAAVLSSPLTPSHNTLTHARTHMKIQIKIRLTQQKMFYGRIVTMNMAMNMIWWQMNTMNTYKPNARGLKIALASNFFLPKTHHTRAKFVFGDQKSCANIFWWPMSDGRGKEIFDADRIET